MTRTATTTKPAVPAAPAEGKTPAATPPAIPPGTPDCYTIRGKERKPPATLFQSVGRRVNDGLYRMSCDLSGYIYDSAAEDFPCDIHEIDDRVHAFAGLVRAVRELHLVPGCRDALSALPADYDLFAYRG